MDCWCHRKNFEYCRNVLFITILTVAFIVFCATLDASIEVCEKDEFCLALDNYSKNIERKVYVGGGRYFIGYYHEFIHIPRKQRVLIISDRERHLTGDESETYAEYLEPVNARSLEGMKLFTFEYAVHFTYGTYDTDSNKELADELIQIYRDIGDDMMMDIMYRIGLGVMKTASQKFEAFSFFRERETVNKMIEAELQFHMRKFGVNVVRGLILDVDVPEEFDAAIKETEVVRQRQKEYDYLKTIEATTGQTRVDVAHIAAEKTIAAAQAQADATEMKLEAEATALVEAIKIEKEALDTVEKALFDRTTTTDLMGAAMNSFVYLRIAEQKILEGSTVNVYVENPLFNA